MRTPRVEVQWIPDSPRTLVMVKFYLPPPSNADDHMYIGSGSTFAEAFDALAKDLRKHAEYQLDDALRKKLRE